MGRDLPFRNPFFLRPEDRGDRKFWPDGPRTVLLLPDCRRGWPDLLRYPICESGHCGLRSEEEDQEFPHPDRSRKPGRINLIKGSDGKIYAKISTTDFWFRVEEGKNLVVVSEPSVPSPKSSLPDGRQFSVIDNRLLRIENPTTREAKEIPLNYKSAGSYIFVLGTGPDSRIYGSSMLPLPPLRS